MSAWTGTSTAVFVDSAAFYALSDRTSIDFTQAQAVQRRLVAERRRLVTTNFVLAECHALHLNRLGRHAALSFLTRIDQSAIVVFRVDAIDERRAREIIETYDDKDFSYTDATSFAVMERLGIGEAFSFDRHFAQYGLHVLGLEP